ncbi:hypothetical protein PV371_10915 [Streptomyces sp. TX20-6-3]|uniref:hypothetical protein n=1 Tax=Streptomyces sp. TX20-6-3 TaxID=3028705 RepID=UPI0029A00E7C|nr:hypothetical protein [Streptomyces sp. TX20-6-3]MDX2560157.1 hypothetical protein [Streptomyces sp. TX20-6-3]
MTYPQSNAALSARPVPFEIPLDAPRSGVIHVRHWHTDRFTIVGNHLAQHPCLSAAAIGLGVYIQSLADGTDVTVKTLTLRFREGEITIRRALNELVVAGYVERRRVALGGGRFATRTLFYDKPGCGAGRRRDTGASEAAPDAAPEAAPDAAPDAAPEATPVHVDPVPPAPSGESEARPVPVPVPAPVPLPEASPVPPRPDVLQGPATDILARLRTVDPRLLLSWRDVLRLAPAVEKWLARAASPAQVLRTLTAGLPPAHVPIHHPGRFVEFRLSALLPPPLAVVPPPSVTDGPAPLVNCDGCDRAFRSHDPEASCSGCRPAA